MSKPCKRDILFFIHTAIHLTAEGNRDGQASSSLSKSVMAVPNRRVLHVPEDVFEQDLLHNLSREASLQPPTSYFLSFWKTGACNVCLFAVTGILPRTVIFQTKPCNDIGQLPLPSLDATDFCMPN